MIFYTKGMAAFGVRFHLFLVLLESGVAMTLFFVLFLFFAQS